MATVHPASLNRRQRRFIAIGAHLVVLAFVFQIFAFDHWHNHGLGVEGIPGTSSHAAHCHGGSAGCADAGGVADLGLSQGVVLRPPAWTEHALSLQVSTPGDVSPITPDEPPRL
jgi:hypothetical protein